MHSNSDAAADRPNVPELSRDVRELVGPAALPVNGLIDLDDAADVERAAVVLVRRFLEADDGAAFELLAKVSVPLLEHLAHEQTRCIGLAVPAVTLVSEFMTAVFLDADVRNLGDLARGSFTRFATEALARAAERHLQQLSNSSDIDAVRSEEVAALLDGEVFLRLVAEGGPIAAGSAARWSDPSVAEPLDCDVARASFAVAFHRLEGRHRRILLLLDVDRMPAASAALQLGLDLARVEDALAQARAALAQEVRSVLGHRADAARASDAVVADLVYELAKAALLTLEDVRRRLHCQRPPRSVRTVSRNLRHASRPEQRTVVARIVDASLRQEVRDARGLAVAKLTVSVLEQLEGRSGRQRLPEGLLEILDGRPDAAQRLFEAMLTEDHPESIRQSLCLNYLWSLNRQQKYREAFDRGPAFVAEFPKNRMLVYNMSVAAANLGDFREFSGYAGRFRLMPFESRDVESKWRGLIRFEAPRFGEVLCCSEDTVEEAFGFRAESDSALSPTTS